MNVDELNKTLEAMQDRDWEDKKFTAALKGVNLDKIRRQEESRFEQIKRQALAQASGMTEEQVEYNDLGFGVEVEDED